MEAMGSFLIGLLAWLAALLGPSLLALWWWRATAGRSGAWLAHILFLPSVLAIEWIAVGALFLAAHDDGDGSPGLGLALLLPFALLAGSIAAYYGAVGWRTFRHIRRSGS